MDIKYTNFHTYINNLDAKTQLTFATALLMLERDILNYGNKHILNTNIGKTAEIVHDAANICFFKK